MSWFNQVTSYIDNNFEDFISHFFPNSSPIRRGKSFILNPSPCCGHNDSFSFAIEMNAAHCFSCGMKGSRIGVVEQTWGLDKGRAELELWSGIKNKNKRPEGEKETSEDIHQRRMNEIYAFAVQFYNMQLFSDNPDADKALKRQLGSNLAKGERGHFEHTLKEFKVGLSLDTYDAFEGLMRKKGYTEEELSEAKKLTWVPPFYYVYPYFDANGNLIRINTKPFKRTCLGTPQVAGGYSYNCLHETYDTSSKEKKRHEEETGHSMSPDVYSTGQKDQAYYYSPEVKRKRKYLLLVEGENDVLSAHEELKANFPKLEHNFLVAGIGGNIGVDAFSSPFFRQFEMIYEAFDNDEAGDRYRKQLNKEAADINVMHIEIDKDLKDIDNYLKVPAENQTIERLIENAQVVETQNFLIEREGTLRHLWHAKSRRFTLTFDIEKYNKSNGQLTGTIISTKNGVMTDKKVGGIDTARVDASMTPAKLALSDHLERYYNQFPWDRDKPVRPIRELADVVHLTKNYQQVIKQIGWYLHQSNDKEYEKNFYAIEKIIGDQRVIAEILKEVNGFMNSAVDPHAIFPKINLSQHFNVTNNDAYFYFSRIIKDGETPKLVPCLLSNRKEEIRLDLMKRKDPQCVLLVQNRYEIPYEVPTAVMDPIEVSLQPYWVDKWKDNEIKPEDIDPGVLIKEIENFVKKCYYLEESTLKVLTLWIYSTYYYMLFKSGFPYLMFTGPKGTGKSTLDLMVYLLSLNAKIALDISESALYRSITFEGGTFILDEVEHLADKKHVDTNGYAKILKGGYSDSANVYRTNMDKGGATERFSVFGPKVISNINGIDDVIADRCIYVRTFRVPEEKLRGLEDPQIYREELRADVHAITSRCVLSALENFKEVSDRFHGIDSLFETGSARLTQILKPLVTIARFVGGDYEEHLMKYYDTEIKQTKDDISEGTTEGMVRTVLKRISEEFLGLQSEQWATDPTQHLYGAKIEFSPSTKVFEVENLHVKVLCEEMNNGEEIEMKVINQTLKAILGPSFDIKNNRRQTTATISDENLQKALGGKRHIRVYRYTLNAEDFVDTAKYKNHRTTKEEPALF